MSSDTGDAASSRAYLWDVVKDWALAGGLALVVYAGWAAFQPAPKAAGVVPTLELPDLEGGMFTLAEVEHDAVVVNFWATWCGPCRREIPAFSSYADAHPEVGVYGVSVDDLNPRQLASASKRLGITYPVLHDQFQAVARDWGVTVFPTTFVLDATGHIVSVKVGTMSESALAERVEEAKSQAL